MARPDIRGRTAPTREKPDLPPLSTPEYTVSRRLAEPPSSRPFHRRFFALVRRVFRRVVGHECHEIAGEMAFDFSFSIFPAALFAAALAGLLNITPEFVSDSLDVLGIFLTDPVRAMVEKNVQAMVAGSSEELMTIGLIGAIWAATSAISATIKALNRAYGVAETRSFWHRRLLSLVLMFAAGFAMVVAFNLLIMGTWIEQELLRRAGLEEFLPTLVALIKWPIGFFSAIVMAGILYRTAPNCKPGLWGVLPGAALFAVLWFFLSKAFGYYVGNYSYYNRVTGTLGVFIVVQLWIYLTALILLLCAELNAEIASERSPAEYRP